jgi:hypothetical protein
VRDLEDADEGDDEESSRTGIVTGIRASPSETSLAAAGASGDGQRGQQGGEKQQQEGVMSAADVHLLLLLACLGLELRLPQPRLVPIASLYFLAALGYCCWLGMRSCDYCVGYL